MTTPLEAFDALIAQLTAQAVQLAEARAASASLARTDPAARWRHAALLWPRFIKGAP